MPIPAAAASPAGAAGRGPVSSARAGLGSCVRPSAVHLLVSRAQGEEPVVAPRSAQPSGRLGPSRLSGRQLFPRLVRASRPLSWIPRPRAWPCPELRVQSRDFGAGGGSEQLGPGRPAGRQRLSPEPFLFPLCLRWRPPRSGGALGTSPRRSAAICGVRGAKVERPLRPRSTRAALLGT